MDQFYYEAVDQMQKMKVDRNYMLGWIGGYMSNPKIEEQRLTESYEAGYADGGSKETSNFKKWGASREFYE